MSVSMIEVDTGQLKRAVEAQHACTATLIQSVPVKETFGDKTLWESFVHVFKINGHPRARPTQRQDRYQATSGCTK